MTAPASNGLRCSLIMVGEIRTGLVMNRVALPTRAVAELLSVVAGERVRSYERPVRRTVSPDLLHGVDCRLSTAPGARLRGIGTLQARGRVVGGRVLQCSTRAVLETGSGLRLPWTHYVERPGVVEVTGRSTPTDLAARFVAGCGPDSLEPGAVNALLLARLQRSRLLDQRPPLRTRRTRLRWSAVVDDSSPRFGGTFTLVGDELRTFRIVVPPSAGASPDHITLLCEDLAFHDWLLTTVAAAADRARAGRGAAIGLMRLRPVVDDLVHLWMPGAVVAPGFRDIWDQWEAHAGFTRQWSACVDRVRDRLALLESRLPTGPGPG
ncbi:SCO2521 family protein [Streptomyces violaceus]|uniref:SCO2521 family protein n=1 Tax=Streptomyces violaceus TaxID=1936 RepID=UPI002E1DCF87